MSKINDLLKKINVEKITEEYSFEDLPDGYYLCEVESAEWTESKKGDDMIKWQFKVVDEGITFDDDMNKMLLKGTTGRKIFSFHVIKNESGLNRALSDLLKFEEKENVSILQKELFNSFETISDSLQVLTGMRIYISLETSEDKQTKETSQWKRFVSWKGARQLELA